MYFQISVNYSFYHTYLDVTRFLCLKVLKSNFQLITEPNICMQNQTLAFHSVCGRAFILYSEYRNSVVRVLH